MTVLPLQVAADAIINNVVRFVPRLVWALVVLGLGVVVARKVGTRATGTVYRSDVVANWLAEPAGTGTKVLLYYFAATIALAELGVNTSVLVVFLDGIAFGIGAGAALVVGIAIGWGSSDYVSERVESWLDSVRADEDETVPPKYREPPAGGQPTQGAPPAQGGQQGRGAPPAQGNQQGRGAPPAQGGQQQAGQQPGAAENGHGGNQPGADGQRPAEPSGEPPESNQPTGNGDETNEE